VREPGSARRRRPVAVATGGLVDDPTLVPEGTDPRGLSQTMGNLAFYLMLLLAVPLFLAALGQSALVAPLTEMLRILLSYLPNLAAAAVSIGLGWVVARILRQLVRNLLIGVGLDRAAERAGLVPPTGGVRRSALVATIVYFVAGSPSSSRASTR
jgi:Conserved TM helix